MTKRPDPPFGHGYFDPRRLLDDPNAKPPRSCMSGKMRSELAVVMAACFLIYEQELRELAERVLAVRELSKRKRKRSKRK